MVFAMCMTSFITTVEATTCDEIQGVIVNEGWNEHPITIPAGAEVRLELNWDNPDADLDFVVFDTDYNLISGYRGGPGVAATAMIPERFYMIDLAVDTDFIIGIYGYYVPDPDVAYTLSWCSGTDLFPELVPGGLSVGALTSWHHASRHGLYSASEKSAHSYVFSDNPWRQTIMPWYSWWNRPIAGFLPTYYAGDPLLVGGLTNWWWMDEYTINEVREDLALYTIEYRVDGIPIEDLGHVTEGPIRADNVRGQWYWRLPTVIFKPGELYEVLYDLGNVDELHTFGYYIDGEAIFFGYFYLLWEL